MQWNRIDLLTVKVLKLLMLKMLFDNNIILKEGLVCDVTA